jgi:hypothetical protein
VRPCQNCNAAIGNADKVCPACGADQLASVGFQKAAPKSGRQSDELHPPEPDGPQSWFDVLLGGTTPYDYAALCVIGVAAFLLFLYTMSSSGALLVFSACLVLTIVVLGVMNGG